MCAICDALCSTRVKTLACFSCVCDKVICLWSSVSPPLIKLQSLNYLFLCSHGYSVAEECSRPAPTDVLLFSTGIKILCLFLNWFLGNTRLSLLVTNQVGDGETWICPLVVPWTLDMCFPMLYISLSHSVPRPPFFLFSHNNQITYHPLTTFSLQEQHIFVCKSPPRSPAMS